MLLARFQQSFTEEQIQTVLDRIVLHVPHWITDRASPASSLQPRSRLNALLLPTEYVPAWNQGACSLDGGVLFRWKLWPSTCVTFATGLRTGIVVFLRCATCGAVYGGPWCWRHVHDERTFPAGHHKVFATQGSTEELGRARWFFATPSMCWEVSLLQWCLLLAARGGVSWTALYVIYTTLWKSTAVDTQMATRQHFVAFLEAAVMVWGALKLIARATLPGFDTVELFLRPHHIATDFVSLLDSARKAFQDLAARHSCKLFDEVPVIVVDGKWSLQLSVCNERGSGLVWSSSLRTGFLSGCTARPERGSKYCQQHQPPAEEAPRGPQLSSHREVVRGSSIVLQYDTGDGSWADAADLPVSAVRHYEVNSLPKKTASAQRPAEECGADVRRGTPEPSIGRKSAGMLIAVSPCLQILGLRPTYSTESITQVLLFVQHVLVYMVHVSWVVYDFACGVVRHMRTQCRQRAGKPEETEWRRMAGLRWVIDKLHFQGHKGCRNPTSTWFLPDVNPYAHTVLRGVDTEAAEQVFHIVSRWQDSLSSAHPVHNELLLLVFSHEHNSRHECQQAWDTYRGRQSAPSTAHAAPTCGDETCSQPVAPAKRRRQQTEAARCCDASGAEAAAAPVQPAEVAAVPLQPVAADRGFLGCERVVVNAATGTVHRVDATVPGAVAVGCGWVPDPQAGNRATRTADLRGLNLSSCGTCFGQRLQLNLED
ncbi:unnamed protein product [Effrenium voratum]|nr:unnamed protein product [Effrenium voratum]